MGGATTGDQDELWEQSLHGNKESQMSVVKKGGKGRLIGGGGFQAKRKKEKTGGGVKNTGKKF